MNNGYIKSQYNNKNSTNHTLGIIFRPRNALKHSKGIIN